MWSKSERHSASVSDLPWASPLATTLGTYPSSATADSTVRRVRAATASGVRKYRETVAMETPASLATSYTVGCFATVTSRRPARVTMRICSQGPEGATRAWPQPKRPLLLFHSAVNGACTVNASNKVQYMAKTLYVRSGSEEHELAVTDGTIRASDLRRISTDAGPLATYDPGLLNTASCRSSITYIDGDAGILEYRGYPIEQLAEKSTYLEVAYLLLKGELPNAAQLATWENEVNHHRLVHENAKDIITKSRYDSHPMAKLMSAVASLHAFYPSSRNITDACERELNMVRLLAKMPTLAAFAYRHSLGRNYVYPSDELGFVENFLSMLFKRQERHFIADERLVRAIDVLFILHADHEQNCSTNAVRAVASAGNDPYTSAVAGIAALFGPLHGGANEAVLKMLSEIGSVDRVPEFIEGVKAGQAKLMGFGHRVYKNYDPRARIIKKSADEVFEVTGVNPRLAIAQELERIALNDEYFVSRKLYPNVDFYSGLIYEALKFPPAMFTVMFAVPRTAGWVAQWQEGVLDPEQKITRPKQIYTGLRGRDYAALDAR